MKNYLKSTCNHTVNNMAPAFSPLIYVPIELTLFKRVDMKD